ncbi:nuclear receptor binding SET domain protein [Zeugodacus cucurbitae]|uniref:nuclear receptor binding SET domain protein n=1 Tax=Zeugodacus cucurbitae TaxID=28588 RepID=UPI000596897A|nr:nuclear receptor binding SET domain protein [Zeugodacus cucurbitae]
MLQKIRNMRSDQKQNIAANVETRSKSSIDADASFGSPVERIKVANCNQNTSDKKLKRMKSEKCNFINKRENCEPRLSTPTTSTAFSDCEGKRKSTSTCIGSSKRLSSSTPRRKRNMLANLYSDLSPKYIGFATPPSSSTVAITGSESEGSLQTRSARHRKLLICAASPEIGGSDSEILSDSSKALLGCVRRARNQSVTPSPNRLSARKKFESPIDKLLALNGSVVLNDISKEKIVKNLTLSPNSNLNITINENDRELSELQRKSESVVSVHCENNNVTNLVNMERKQAKDINDSLLTENNEEWNENKRSHITRLIKKESVNVVKNSEREIANFSKDENYREESGENLETFSTEVHSGDNFINPTAEVKIENESFDNTTHCKIESVESPIDNADAELQYDLEEGESGESMILNNAVGLSAKSPSAVSLDSAKGSSVVTGMDWMTFSTGDIFWGQIYTYCYWPCIVCPDPEGNTISTERNLRNGEEYVLVHVRFFADSGRRNWVKRENLIPYTDLENYKQHMREIRKKYGKKSVKYKVLLPKPSKVMIWREAIKEANKVSEIVYEDRLTKFFEIYEHKKVLQKIQRKNRKLSTDNNSRTDSLSHDSMESLIVKNPLASGKRDRSVSPYSPAFSPLKPLSSTKRRKLSDASTQLLQIAENSIGDNNETLESSNNNTEPNNGVLKETEANSSTSFAAMHAMEMCNSEYRKFYNAMREFVLEDNTDECLERSLMVASRNIWALKQINRHQVQRRLLVANNEHELGSSLVENRSGEVAVKRLSNRLKTLRHRHSLPAQMRDVQHLESQEKPQGAEGEVQVVDKPKRLLNRPIEEVIDDIFNLDNKYLFRGLARDPVCKYCLHPGGALVRCAKGCQTWLHADCIGKDPTALKKARNGGRRKLSIARRSSSKLSIDIKPSFESPSMPINNERELPGTSSALTTYHVTADGDVDEHIIKISPEVICDSCALGKARACAVCKEDHTSDTNKEELIICNMPQCLKAFHPACCRYWPQAKFTKSKNKIESFRCPSHVCHTCVSDDPKGKFQHLSNSKLTKCVKCPASYHMDSTCIPAGSQILTAAHIICPRHSASSKSDAHVNVSWCFICVGGGQVICCETCPTAVHAKCLNIPLDPSEGYICEECESGRMPLYGEMVWAKFNSFRWWPAIILPPTEIPQNIRRKAHNTNDFVVRFFGTHDHGWISRRRVYLYLEGDSSEPPKTKSSLDQSYNRGVEEAKRIYEIIKSKKLAQRLSNENKEKLHPQPYVRIKANRAVHPVKLHIDLEKVNKCECRSYDENPCGPNSNCLNRVLYHECNPKLCPAGERCQNQMFESRLSPRLDVVYLKERGFGLVCREPINAGDFIIEYVGEIIDDNEFKQRMSQKSLDRDENFYFLSVEKDYIIDAGPKGNLARFMNHSCDPNCETQKWSVNGLNRIGLFAIKDIPADTELTFNYHWDDLLGNQKKLCLCGAVKCVGEIGGKNKEDKVSKENTAVVANKAKAGATRKRKPLKRLQNRAREGNEKKVSKKRSNVTVKIPQRIGNRVGDQRDADENNISLQNGDNTNNTADKTNEDDNTTNIF